MAETRVADIETSHSPILSRFHASAVLDLMPWQVSLTRMVASCVVFPRGYSGDFDKASDDEENGVLGKGCAHAA